MDDRFSRFQITNLNDAGLAFGCREFLGSSTV